LLADGEDLTAAMLQELADALDERLKAVDTSWGCTLVATNGLRSRLVSYTGPGSPSSPTISTWHQVASLLIGTYRRPEWVETGAGSSLWGNSTDYLTEALAASGAPGALNTYLLTPLDTRGYWNLIREAIRLLRWRSPSLLATGRELRESARTSPPVDFATAKSSWAGSSPTAISNITGTSLFSSAVFFSELFPVTPPNADDHYLFATQHEGTFTVPTGPLWASWQAWVIGDVLTDPLATYQNQVSASVVVRLGGVDTEAPGASVGTWRMDLGNYTLSGSQSIELLPGATAGSDRWDVFDAGAGTDISGRRGAYHIRSIGLVVLKPDFTHP
ncbi:MAG: hypothetical protein MUE42_14310, partial [Opitutaceae bacterium]|nr:hypothetical protein [Opitutaceae bacterium]